MRDGFANLIVVVPLAIIAANANHSYFKLYQNKLDTVTENNKITNTRISIK